MKKEKYLIITYDMIPFCQSWGSCQRMYYLADYLSSKTSETYVLFCKKEYFGNFGKKIRFKIYPIGFRSKSIKIILKLLRGKKDINSGTSKRINMKKFITKLLIPVIYFEKKLLNEINLGSGLITKLWLSNALKTIIKIIKEKNIKVVIFSGPPFSVFLSVHFIRKKFPSLKLVLDYRDPWNVGERSEWIASRKEAKILHKVNLIITASSTLSKEIIKKYNVKRNKVKTISNGYSEMDWISAINSINGKKFENDKLIISHVGNISFNPNTIRSANKIIDSFKKVLPQEKCELRFIGVNDDDGITRLSSDSVKLLPSVDLREALLYMLKSDVLLVINSAKNDIGKYICTAKFFDYVRSGKPIFGIGDKDTFFNIAINKMKLGITSDYVEENIDKAFLKIFEAWQYKRLVKFRKDNIDLEKLSREHLNSKYHEYLKSINDF